jgi:hypothetical protein
MSHIDGSYRTNFASNTQTQAVGGAQMPRALKGNPSGDVSFMRTIESGARSDVQRFLDHQGGAMTLQQLLGLTPD